MERLTKIIDLHNALPLSMVEIETKTNEPCVYGHAVDVLAAYEDTGLTSGQVQRLQQENSDLKRLMKLAVDDIEGLFVACDSEYNMHNKLTVPGNCKYCKNYSENGCVNDAICKWRYADEAKELINEL